MEAIYYQDEIMSRLSVTFITGFYFLLDGMKVQECS